MFTKCMACVHYGGNENSSHAGGRELICTVMHFTLISSASCRGEKNANYGKWR